jgi:hypothetical protein
MRYFFYTLLIFSFASCNKKDPAPDKTMDMIPASPALKPAPLGSIITRFINRMEQLDLKMNISMTIAKDTTINGSKYFVTTNKYYFSNKADGYYEYDRNINQKI